MNLMLQVSFNIQTRFHNTKDLHASRLYDDERRSCNCFKITCAVCAAGTRIDIIDLKTITQQFLIVHSVMPNTIPVFDFASRAQVTRKALERLACFSKIQR